MMKGPQLLLLPLIAVGLLVAGFFLFWPKAPRVEESGPGQMRRIEEPRELGGSLEAGTSRGAGGEEGPRGREESPRASSSRGRSQARGGGGSIALQLFLGGAPLAGAELKLLRVPGGKEGREKTDGAGRVRFEGVPPGRYMIQAEDERVPKSFRIGPRILKAGQALDLGRVEVPQAAALRFRLLEPDGRPLADTELRLFREGSFGFRGAGLPGKTDAKGRATFLGLSAGDWTLSVVTRKYPVFEKSVSLAPGENIDLGDLSLERGFFLLGRVVDGQGRGIEGARLIPSQHKEERGMKIETYDPRAAVRSDAGGKFRLVTREKGGQLRVRKEGYRPKTVSFSLEEGELRVVLSRTFGISGKVVGAVRGRTSVFAHPIGSGIETKGSMGGSWKRVQVGPKGEFSLDGVPPGDYGLLALAGGEGASVERRVQLLSGSSKRIELVLQPGAQLELLVVNPAGNPLPGVRAELYYRSPLLSEPKWGLDALAMFLSQDKRPSLKGETNAQGRASFKGLWLGKALLILKGKGLSKKIVSPVLLRAGKNPLRVEMEGAARVLGKALGPDGKPMVGAQVSVAPFTTPGNTGNFRAIIGGEDSKKQVQGDGSFRIEGIKPGRYRVSLHPPLAKTGAFFFDGSEPSLDQKVVTLAAGEERRLTLRAKPQWTIQGRVLFQGEPVAGAVVSMKRADSPGGLAFPSKKKTDRSGRFRFEWVGMGKYHFRAFPPEKGVRTPRQTLDLPAGGGLRNLDLELGGGLVKGRIALEGERPKGLELILIPASEAKQTTTQIAMIRVRTSTNGEEAQEQSMVIGDGPNPVVPKEDGSFAFHFVAPGEWILKVRAGEGRGKTTLKSLPLKLAKNQGLDLGDISLEKTFPVNLVVKDEAGRDLPLASVKIYPLQDGKPASSPVFKGVIRGGKAKVPGLEVGVYKVVVIPLSLEDPKPKPPQEGRLEVMPGGKVRGGRLRLR